MAPLCARCRRPAQQPQQAGHVFYCGVDVADCAPAPHEEPARQPIPAAAPLSDTPARPISEVIDAAEAELRRLEPERWRAVLTALVVEVSDRERREVTAACKATINTSVDQHTRGYAQGFDDGKAAGLQEAANLLTKRAEGLRQEAAEERALATLKDAEAEMLDQAVGLLHQGG